jgi:hypothetical protein
MEVSTFEILYKPITPALEPGTEAIARRVLQGYFLTIANLEQFDFRFRIGFNITLPVPDNPSRRLDTNALFISDVAAPDNVFSTALTRSPAGGNRYVTSFTVPAGKTALVVLLPNVTVPSFFSTGPADIEIRGHVSLELPCLLRVTFPPLRISLVPQEGAPARVLLNAEHRSVYLPPGWPGATVGDLDFDQTAVAIALATGRALNEVPQVSPCTFSVVGLEAVAIGRRIAAIEPAADPADLAAGLVAALARLDANPDNLAALTKLVEEAGIPVRIEPARPRK